MNRFVNHRFTNMYRATIGTDFLSKTVDIGVDTVTLQVTCLSTCAAAGKRSSHARDLSLLTMSSAICCPPFVGVCMCVCVRSGTPQAQRGSSLWVRLCTEEVIAACWSLMSHPLPVSAPWMCGGRSFWFRASLRIHLSSLLLCWAAKLT